MKESVNIVIPMAGAGSRFMNAGYSKPKPFIDVHGKPMIDRVIENLYYPDAKYLLIASKDHVEKEKEIVREIEKSYNATFIIVDKIMEGAACTVLFAREHINNNTPLIMANSDQIIDINIGEFINNCLQKKIKI